MRPSGRAPDQLRPVSLEPGFSRHAEGSCLGKLADQRGGPRPRDEQQLISRGDR
jgi:hypothetical protein